MKILNYGEKIAKSVYKFSYSELCKIRSTLSQDAYFKAVRNICNFYEEKYLDDDDILKEIAKIRRLAKRKEAGSPDIYTPTDEELKENLQTVQSGSKAVYNFYLGLVYSGVRIVEFGRFADNPSQYKVIDKGDFVKILVNHKRGAKNCNFIYLPKWLYQKKFCSYKYFIKFFQENKDILRPKYVRNWFYSNCLRQGIPSGVADFYQGRSPASIGDRHYLDKERMADEKYCLIQKLDLCCSP